MKNFFMLLNSLNVTDLKTRLHFLKSGKKPTTKADIIEYLYNDCLLNHEDYWDHLSFLEKKVIAEAIYQSPTENEGVFSAYRFKAKYGEIPDYFAPRSRNWGRTEKKYTPSHLELFFYNRKMPDIFRQLMKAYVQKPDAMSIPTIDEDKLPKSVHYELHEYQKKKNGSVSHPPVKIRCMEAIASNELEALLRLIATGTFAVSDKTNRATAVSIRKLDALLLDGDYYLPDDAWEISKWEGSPLFPMRSFAWPLIVQSAGLAKRVGKKLQLTVKGKKAITAPLHESALLMYQRWCKKGLLDEFSRIDTIKGQKSKGRVMSAVAGRKEAIDKVLQQCPVNEWIAIDSLFQYIKSISSELQVCLNEWKLYISDSEYGSLGYSGYHDFEILEGRYILVYFFEYLATMGLLDIAYTVPYLARKDDFKGMWGTEDLDHLSRYDGLRYFRINPLGAYCLGRATSYQPIIIEKPALLEIDEKLHINLRREADATETIMLERYAKKLSHNEWQLSEGKMLQAMENNFSTDNFQQFLQENSENPELSQPVQAFFAEANERGNALQDKGAARLLHCYSEAFAKVLASNPATRKYCIHAEGKILVVTEKNQKQFAKGLRKLGYIYPQ